MTAGLTLLLVAASALGCGTLLLAGLRTGDHLPAMERGVWAAVLGFGILGWSAYGLAMLGMARPEAFLTLCLLFLPGLRPWLLPIAAMRMGGMKSPWRKAILGIALAIAAVDFMEALAPPSDADTIAYHYALVKEILRDGRLVFVPRAVDGATPLIVQMVYAIAMSLGGERAANLVVMASGWLLPLLAVTTARRWLPDDWAWGCGLLILTLPAVLVGAGTGQIETRLALFCCVAMLAAADLRTRPSAGTAAAAGVATGLYAGAKLTGLIFGPVIGVAVLAIGARRKSLWPAAAFAGAALVATFPYYLWSWINTGDPVFPFLYGLLPYHPGVPWDAEAGRFLRATLAHEEMAVPKTLGWLVAYPFVATFGNVGTFDSVRAGFGPWPVMVLPPAAAGAWMCRRDGTARDMFVVLACCAGFALLWFFLGQSQRLRHYLPIAPIAIVAMTALAWRLEAARKPLALACAAVIFVQCSVQAMMGRNFIAFSLGRETAAEFLDRNVGYRKVVDWASANLGPHDRLLHQVRQLNYYLDVPYLFAHPVFDDRIDLRPDADDPRRFLDELTRHGITHVLVLIPSDGRIWPPLTPDTALPKLVLRLEAAGCSHRVATISTSGSPISRAFSAPDRSPSWFAVMAVDRGAGCRPPERDKGIGP